MVFHDENINAKTNKTGKVADLSLEKLKEAIVKISGEEILTPNEVFETFHSAERKWILDIKTTGIKKQLEEWLDERLTEGLSKNQVILFGAYDVLDEYKDSGYELGCTLVWGNFANRLRVLFTPGKIIDRCENVGCDYLVLPIIFASDSLIKSAKEKDIIVWTYGSDKRVDHDDSAKRGIAGLIVDRPAEVVKNFDR